MTNLETAQITALVLLSLLLYYRTLGTRQRPQRPRPWRFQPAATPIDTTPIASKVAAIRNNPAAALQTKAVRKSRRAMLIAAARGVIRDLRFFRTREHEHGT